MTEYPLGRYVPAIYAEYLAEVERRNDQTLEMLARIEAEAAGADPGDVVMLHIMQHAPEPQG